MEVHYGDNKDMVDVDLIEYAIRKTVQHVAPNVVANDAKRFRGLQQPVRLPL